MKTLIRKNIIREYDYKQLVKENVPSLYTRASFAPLTLKELEHERLLQILKNESEENTQNTISLLTDLEYPRNYLYCLKKSLYNEKYVDWFSLYDDNGYMWIQAKKNTPRSKLGWGTFEYDYK